MQVKDCPTCLLLECAPFGTLDKFLFAIKTGFVPDWYLKSIHESTEDSYSSHVARDLMSSAVQIAEAMVSLCLVLSWGGHGAEGAGSWVFLFNLQTNELVALDMYVSKGC